MARPLTIEEKEILISLSDQETIGALEAFLSLMVEQDFAARVLSSPLTLNADINSLMILKANFDGASRLARSMTERLSKLRERSTEG
jgi:hypothetical protein